MQAHIDLSADLQNILADAKANGVDPVSILLNYIRLLRNDMRKEFMSAQEAEVAAASAATMLIYDSKHRNGFEIVWADVPPAIELEISETWKRTIHSSIDSMRDKLVSETEMLTPVLPLQTTSKLKSAINFIRGHADGLF